MHCTAPPRQFAVRIARPRVLPNDILVPSNAWVEDDIDRDPDGIIPVLVVARGKVAPPWLKSSRVREPQVPVEVCLGICHSSTIVNIHKILLGHPDPHVETLPGKKILLARIEVHGRVHHRAKSKRTTDLEAKELILSQGPAELPFKRTRNSSHRAHAHALFVIWIKQPLNGTRTPRINHQRAPDHRHRARRHTARHRPHRNTNRTMIVRIKQRSLPAGFKGDMGSILADMTTQKDPSELRQAGQAERA